MLPNKQGSYGMTNENTDDNSDTHQHSAKDGDVPLKEIANKAPHPTTRSKGVNIKNNTDNKRGSGGLDNLGSGKLP
jgi:hypothetical protein